MQPIGEGLSRLTVLLQDQESEGRSRLTGTPKKQPAYQLNGASITPEKQRFNNTSSQKVQRPGMLFNQQVTFALQLRRLKRLSAQLVREALEDLIMTLPRF